MALGHGAISESPLGGLVPPSGLAPLDTTVSTSQAQGATAASAVAADTTSSTSQGQSAAATGALAASTTADTSQGQSAAVTADAEPNLPNLIDISEGFDQAYWANTIATLVDPDVSVSPVGTTTVDEATFNFTGNSNLRAHVTGLTIGETYTFSAWVQSGRSGSATHIRLAANNLAAWGTASSVKQALTGSLVRISTSWVQTSTTSAALLIGTPDETGAGDSDCIGTARVWGAMFNTGGVRAAYLKTPADIDVVADTSQGQSAAALMSIAQDAIVSVAQGQSAAATGALAASTTADTSQGQSAAALMSIAQDAIVSVAQGQSVDAAGAAAGAGAATSQGQSVAAVASVSIDATVGTSQGQSVAAGTITALDAAVATSQGQSAAATGALAASVSSSTLQGQSAAALADIAQDAIVSVSQAQSVSGLAEPSLIDQIHTAQAQSAAAVATVSVDAVVATEQAQTTLGHGNYGTDIVAATAQAQSTSALAYSYEGGVDHMRQEWRVLVTYRGDARLLVEPADEVHTTLSSQQYLVTEFTDDVVTLA